MLEPIYKSKQHLRARYLHGEFVILTSKSTFQKEFSFYLFSDIHDPHKGTTDYVVTEQSEDNQSRHLSSVVKEPLVLYEC